MGKKRQKVQWFPVDNLDWANGEEQSVRKVIEYSHKIQNIDIADFSEL